jgi:hypothetical protein
MCSKEEEDNNIHMKKEGVERLKIHNSARQSFLEYDKRF